MNGLNFHDEMVKEMDCPLYGQYIDVSEIYQQGRADAINEFAEILKKECKESYENKDLALECKKCMIWRQVEIDEITKQLEENK